MHTLLHAKVDRIIGKAHGGGIVIGAADMIVADDTCPEEVYPSISAHRVAILLLSRPPRARLQWITPRAGMPAGASLCQAFLVRAQSTT